MVMLALEPKKKRMSFWPFNHDHTVRGFRNERMALGDGGDGGVMQEKETR